MNNTIYLVHSKVRPELEKSFDFKDEAIDYAKGYDEGVSDQTWVEAIDIDIDELGNYTGDYYQNEIIWSWDNKEEIEEAVKPAVTFSKEDLGEDLENIPVVDCKVNKVITHAEDEKPVDCLMKKKPLEKPLTDK